MLKYRNIRGMLKLGLQIMHYKKNLTNIYINFFLFCYAENLNLK